MQNARPEMIDELILSQHNVAIDEYVVTDYFIGDLRVYMKNPESTDSMVFPRVFDVLACGHQTCNLKSMVGDEAVVCVRGGHLVLRVVKRSKKRRRYDLLNYHLGPNPPTMHDVDTLWGAPMCMTMSMDTFKDWVARGKVKVLRDLRWPKEAA